MDKVKLGDIAKVISGYAFKSGDFQEGGSAPVIKIKNIKIGNASIDEVDYVNADFFKKLDSKFHVLPGEILISLTGSHITQPNSVVGRVGRYPFDYPAALLNQRAGKVIPDESLVDSSYLFYVLMDGDLRKKIAQMASGSASQANISPSQVESVTVPLPDIEYQKKVGGTLFCYDNLVENNNRRIAILEEMAQSLYREWFVKFRYPGHENQKMIESPLGLIPDGWEVVDTKKIIERLKNGNVYTKEMVSEVGNVIVVDQSRDDYLGFHSNPHDHAATAENPLIIFGDHTCKTQLMVENFSIGPNTIVFRANEIFERPIQYLFYLVKNLTETKEYKRHWSELNSKVVVIADGFNAGKFSILITPYLAQINILKKKNRNLMMQRDLLLPKLISGSITI